METPTRDALSLENPSPESKMTKFCVYELPKQQHKSKKGPSFWGYKLVAGYQDLVEIKYDKKKNYVTWIKLVSVHHKYVGVPFGNMLLTTMFEKINALGHATTIISCNLDQVEFYKAALVIKDDPIDPNMVDEADRELPILCADVHDSLVKLKKMLELNSSYLICWDDKRKWWDVDNKTK